MNELAAAASPAGMPSKEPKDSAVIEEVAVAVSAATAVVSAAAAAVVARPDRAHVASAAAAVGGGAAAGVARCDRAWSQSRRVELVARGGHVAAVVVEAAAAAVASAATAAADAAGGAECTWCRVRRGPWKQRRTHKSLAANEREIIALASLQAAKCTISMRAQPHQRPQQSARRGHLLDRQCVVLLQRRTAAARQPRIG